MLNFASHNIRNDSDVHVTSNDQNQRHILYTIDVLILDFKCHSWLVSRESRLSQKRIQSSEMTLYRTKNFF